MARTTNLRRQHDTVLALAGALEKSIAAMGASPDVIALPVLMMQLAKLTGTLRIHLASEDLSLYPSLLASGRSEAMTTAQRFVAEMGQIGPAFIAYAGKWHSNSAVLDDWAGFRKETADIFAVLAERIRRENEELYPLADALDLGEPPVRAA